MRQLSPLTNLLLACLSAVGLVAALALPWFAPGTAVTPDDSGTSASPGSMEAIAERVGRTFSSDGAVVSGQDALGANRTLLLVLAAVVVVLAAAMLVPMLRNVVRDAMRAAGVASPLLVVFLAVHADTPALELRWGLLATVGVAAFMASAVWHGSAIRAKRRPTAPAAARTA